MRSLYNEQEIDSAYAWRWALAAICGVGVLGNFAYALSDPDDTQSILTKLLFAVLVAVFFGIAHYKKHILLFASYLIVIIGYVLCSFQQKMDTYDAVRTAAIMNFLALSNAVFAPLCWMMFVVTNSLIPFGYWFAISSKISAEFSEDMYYLQIHISILMALFSYFLHKKNNEAFVQKEISTQWLGFIFEHPDPLLILRSNKG